MTRTLHHFARSRGLQLAALLAWVLLAVTPASGMPAAMIGGMQHHADSAPAMQMTGHGDHVASVNSVNSDRPCCGSDDGSCCGHACGCVAACGSVALLAVPRELAPVRFANRSWTQFSSRVPGASSTPPLRPPAA